MQSVYNARKLEKLLPANLTFAFADADKVTRGGFSITGGKTWGHARVTLNDVELTGIRPDQKILLSLLIARGKEGLTVGFLQDRHEHIPDYPQNATDILHTLHVAIMTIKKSFLKAMPDGQFPIQSLFQKHRGNTPRGKLADQDQGYILHEVGDNRMLLDTADNDDRKSLIQAFNSGEQISGTGFEVDFSASPINPAIVYQGKNIESFTPVEAKFFTLLISKGREGVTMKEWNIGEPFLNTRACLKTYRNIIARKLKESCPDMVQPEILPLHRKKIVRTIPLEDRGYYLSAPIPHKPSYDLVKNRMTAPEWRAHTDFIEGGPVQIYKQRCQAWHEGMVFIANAPTILPETDLSFLAALLCRRDEVIYPRNENKNIRTQSSAADWQQLENYAPGEIQSKAKKLFQIIEDIPGGAHIREALRVNFYRHGGRVSLKITIAGTLSAPEPNSPVDAPRATL